jgi:hypothetical protein
MYLRMGIMREIGGKAVVLATAAAVVYAAAAYVFAPLLLTRLPDGTAARLLTDFSGTGRDGVLILLVFGLLVPAFAALGPDRLSRGVGTATPRALGAIRAWVATILLASILWEDIASSAYLPRSLMDSERHWLMGLLHDLPIGFERLLASHGGLLILEYTTAMVLLCAVLGLFTRWAVPAGALLYLLCGAILRGYSWTYHTGVIPLYALLLLSFTPCGDGFSLDRTLRVRRGLDVPPAEAARVRYGIGRFLVWMAIAIPYTLAGLSKLRNGGLLWWTGENMKQMLVATIVEPMHFDFQLTFLLLRGPTWIFAILGMAALVSELAFVLVLVSRIARAIIPAMTAAMHVGIMLLQNILFPDLIAIQAVFYDWRPLLRRFTPAVVVPGSDTAALTATDTGAVPSLVTRRQAVVARVFVVTAVVVWATRTEKFPLTAMQMFSREPRIGAVEYVVPWAVRDDGTRSRARFEQWIPAMADTRYRRLLSRWAAGRDSVGMLEEFLDASAVRANARLRGSRRVRAFELEHRRWDFRAAPDDAQRGELIRTLHYDVVESTAVSRNRARSSGVGTMQASLRPNQR